MDIKSELSWLQKHERIIIVFMVLLVGCFLGNKWINYSAANADAKYAALVEKLDEQQKQNTANAQQTALAVSQYQSAINNMQSQITALTGAIASRDAALAKKQQQIASMTLPQVAQEWEKALGLPINALPVQGVSVVVSEPAARQTVSQLTKTATLEANLTDQKAITGNVQSGLDSANKVISSQTTEIAGLKSTAVLQDQTCKAEVAKVKADARKSKRTWFILGFVSGVATRLLVKF